MSAPAARSSVLATLTANVMAEKKAAAKTLTPVAGERAPRVLPHTEAAFPNDIPQEVIQQKVAELTRIINHLTESRDALAALIGQEPPNVVDLKEVQKQKERAADERAAAPDFNADFKSKQEEAIASVFPGPEAKTDWECPVHHKSATKTSAKTQREYIGCPDCALFKR